MTSDKSGAARVARQEAPWPEQAEKALALCVDKTRANIKRLADQPKACGWAVNGDYFSAEEGFYDISNWTSSFIPGMALLAWEQTEDEYFLKQALRLAPHYSEKVFVRHADTMHDLGFLYSLYSVALFRLTGDRTHREAALQAAEVLTKRFVPEGRYIRAWGRMDELDTGYAGLAIIDCMMNLPLLFWASEQTGDNRFRDAATSHADTTLKYFIRPDDSVFHAYRFDPRTGAPRGGDNYCGLSVDSHWARGTAWAIYGFALAHKYTKDPRYLDVASRLALKFISSLDNELVPVWDFKLNGNGPSVRDSSAAAIAVCGLMELAGQGGQDSKFFHSTRPMLLRLCSADYLNLDPNCPALLRDAQVGDGPGRGQNAYASWGDYYLMEALARDRGITQTFW